MAEVLVTNPPFNIPEDVEVYKDAEKNQYIIKDKTTGDVRVTLPCIPYPKN